jgi:hypothetical protein
LPVSAWVISEAEAVEIAHEVQRLDHPVLDLQVHPQLVSAERIVAVGVAIRLRQRAEVARLAAVIEDHFLVELAQVRHQPNISVTRCSARTSASMSARVL